MPTQVDSLLPTQPIHTPDQGDAAPAPINVVTDKQSTEQQAGDDNALPSQPSPHPPNSVLLGLKEVNSKDSRETPHDGGTTTDHEPQKLTGTSPKTSNCKFYLQGRCRHGRVGKDCSYVHPPHVPLIHQKWGKVMQQRIRMQICPSKAVHQILECQRMSEGHLLLLSCSWHQKKQR